MEDGGAGGREVEADEPRDARVVRQLLRSMGIAQGEYEPRVVHQFLELCYRYVVDVLSDAQIYAEHAGKAIVDPDDVRLAIQSKVNFSFSQPPPREISEGTECEVRPFGQTMDATEKGSEKRRKEPWRLWRKEKQPGLLEAESVLLELARTRNKTALPKTLAPAGSIPLPPEQDTLVSPNYQLLIPRKQLPQIEETEEDEDVPNPTPNANPNPFAEQRTHAEKQQLQAVSQKVSFPLASAAAPPAKRQR
ncbi:hypothetical protein KSP40_PGU013542 [Platanthera guangdongensis]|uniref:Transcription initiation factor TFIID subunit 9 n=1 Tax=Platanthera guangdongensis TaxID=2320717 RepID=A0ABR2N3V6_9ASPA